MGLDFKELHLTINQCTKHILLSVPFIIADKGGKTIMKLLARLGLGGGGFTWQYTHTSILYGQPKKGIYLFLVFVNNSQTYVAHKRRSWQMLSNAFQIERNHHNTGFWKK